MESVTGPIMQLKFSHLGASSIEIGLILGTIPGTVYSLLNPIISFKSDRFRSRWGRRIPFIVFSLPFLVFFLVALAFGDRVGFWLFAHFGYMIKGLSANQSAILVLGAFLVAFTFFNTFVTSTFWYLFNDVVPEHLLARFMAWFRTFSTLSASFYSFLIFPHSSTHSAEIFIGAALLYLVGFGLMCWNVREGQYPPAPPLVGGQTGPIAAIKTYGKETHAFAHYWWLWLCTFIGGLGSANGIYGGGTLFGIFYCQALGLNLQQIGVVWGSLNLTVSVLTLVAGWLADRFHPIRVVLAGLVLGYVILLPANLSWLFWHPAPIVAFWVYLIFNICLAAPIQALVGMWDPPMIMRLFPRTHYGQFCSINAVWRSVSGMASPLITGTFLEVAAHWVGKDRAYIWLPVWGLVFSIPSFFLFVRLYASWKNHGGDADYIAPVLVTSQMPPQTAIAPGLPEMEA